MPESYREYPEGATGDYQIRIALMIEEVKRLKVQWAQIQINRLRMKIAQADVLNYLAIQAEPVAEERIHKAVQGRRATIQKALRKLVDAGKVKRSGCGVKCDPYRYAVPENQNDEQQRVNAGTGHLE